MLVNETNIDKFLGARDTYFEIPDFQRQYSWSQSNCDTFLEDLEEAINEEKDHYLGSIFFEQASRDRAIVIDGQQRITTVLLMLTAIHHWLKDNPVDDPHIVKRVKRDYLENDEDYKGEESRIRLKGETDDAKIFRQIYLEGQGIDSENKDSGLFKAYDYFCKKLYPKFKEGVAPSRYVDGLTKLKIISVELKESDNLQKIFEGINSTGVPLSEGDKIRNSALTLNDDSARKEAAKHWKVIESKLINARERTDHVADFFRKFLIVNMGQDIRWYDIYSQFKAFFKQKIGKDQGLGRTKEFYKLLMADLDAYVALKLNDVGDQYKKLENAIFRIHYLGIEIAYPVLMYALRHYEQGNIELKEVRGFFEVTESYLVRRIIADLRTTGLNHFFHTAPKDIENYRKSSSGSSRLEIYKAILLDKTDRHRFPDENFIRARFTDHDRMKNQYRYFILSSWDDKSQPKESFLLEKIYTKTSNYSTEHIMPQKLSDSWKKTLGRDCDRVHEKYLESLANLTLTGYNPEYSNSSFQEKLNHEHGYKNSNLLINAFIKEQTNWDEEVLKARIEWWIEAIEKMWPRPTSDFILPKKSIQLQTIKLDQTTDSSDLNHSKPRLITIGSWYSQPASTWLELLGKFLNAIWQFDNNCIDELQKDKRTKRFISETPHARNPLEIGESGYYFGGNINTEFKVEFMQAAVDIVGLKDEVAIKIYYPENGKDAQEEII